MPGKADPLRPLRTAFAPHSMRHAPRSVLEARVNPALHLAVLDDEVDITQLLANYLRGQGFRVTPLHDGPSLMALMPVDPSALVLLDLGLPSEDGLSIVRRLREHWRCGLVIVTGRGDSVDKIVGLEVAADGYVKKPFDLRELLARIKAVLRRLAPDHLPVQAPEERHAPGLSAPPASLSTLRFSGGELNSAARSLTNPQGIDVTLTSGEFDLLRAAHARASQPFVPRHRRRQCVSLAVRSESGCVDRGECAA